MVSLSASQYGLLSIGIAIAAFLGTISSRYLINAMSVSRLIVLGASFMFLGSLLLTCVALIGWVSAAHPLMSVLLIMLPLMIIIYGGFGFVIPMTLSTALQKHQAVLGAAGAWFGLSYYILVALFTWGMGLIQNGTLFPMPIYFLILSASALWVSIRINRGNYIN